MRMKTITHHATGATLLALAALTMSAPVSAQEMRFDEAVELVQSSDPDSIRLGLETLGARAEARAVAPIAARIRSGLPAELTELAVTTLAVMERPEAGPVLIELLSHRRPSVRLAAIEAIAATKPRQGGEALMRALDDMTPSVRAAAALALGQIGHRAAIDTLFTALERDVLEAAQAIGQLALPTHMDRLFDHVGQMPFDVLTPAFNELFARSDFPDRAKIDLIGRLAELATPQVKTYLTELADQLPSGRVKSAATEAAERIPG
ncbi:MAG: HEAT repeat domain-containing protein [Deltaproteobacteria bacterium]|nr:HEAT repeat domain-containing protein [Deltaproteobacteria bacterium]